MQKIDFFPVSNRTQQNGSLERRGIRKNSNFVFNVKYASNIQDQARHVLLVVANYKSSTKKSRIKQNNEWTMDLSCTSVEFTNYFWRTLKGSTLWKLWRITKKQEINWISRRNTITERSRTATSTTNNAKCTSTNKDTKTPTWKNLKEQQMKRRCTSQKRQTLSRKKQRHRKNSRTLWKRKNVPKKKKHVTK